MNFAPLWIGAALIGTALSVFLLYALLFFQGKNSLLWRSAPYQPRNPVPWTGVELLLFFAVGFFVMDASALIISGISGHFRGLQFRLHLQEKSLEPAQEKQLSKEHPITQLIVRGQDDPRVFLVVFLAGVVIAPIAEEFLFRLLLQGYVEKQEARLRKFLRLHGIRSALRGLFAVFCSSTIFAAIHWRSTATDHTFRGLLDGFLVLTIGYSALLAMITTYLLCVRGASPDDLGVNWRKIPGDCVLGIRAAFFLLPPVYLLNIGLAQLGLTFDPIPIFFFAVGTGLLYFRTHRILPCIVLHAVLNGVSVVFAYVNAYLFFLVLWGRT